jgi:predicted RecA/RadA family phage recombinase
MNNFVQKGETVEAVESTLTHPYHSDGFVNSGDQVVVGSLVGVASDDAAAATDTVQICREGVFNLSVNGINEAGNIAVAIGDALFIDSGSAAALNKKATKTPFGIALGVVNSAATTTIPVLVLGPGATKPDALQLSFTPAASSSNICLVTVQVKNAAGVAVAGVFNFDLWLSDAITGAGLTGTTASGNVVAGAAGVDLSTYTSKKALRIQTDATGKYILSITDTSKTAFYVCGSTPGSGVTGISAALLTANYG